MALNAAELEQLRPYTGKVQVAEAFMVRHHPQRQAVRQHIRQGGIGALRGSGQRWATLPAADPYQLQAEAFSRQVRQ